MDLTLSWDLFIVFFFSVVTAYSFIIGKHQTLTTLVAAFIAILATQGLGHVLVRRSPLPSSATQLAGGTVAMKSSPRLLLTSALGEILPPLILAPVPRLCRYGSGGPGGASSWGIPQIA